MMRKDIFYKYIFILICIWMPTTAFAQEKISKKVEKEQFMTNAGEISINNKYGDIIINGWDKNSVKITIDIQVTHKKKENAQELIDRIEPIFKTANDFMSITSEIRDKSSSLFSQYFKKAAPFDRDKTNIEINYTINLPVNTEVEISNKYGDIIISDWTGKLKANVKHGDMWINEHLTNANIEVNFGKLKTKNITYGNIMLKNGALTLQESKNLRLKSAGSKINIASVTTLEIVSSKDIIDIQKATHITGDLKYSETHISLLASHINTTMKVADFRIAKIDTPSPNIDINQESSEININVNGTSFNFEATLEQGLLRVPTSFSDINTHVIDKGKRIRTIKASYGDIRKGQTTITGKKGIIILSE
ncbi:hypothetical protein ACFSTE_22755 [Aquimarina hainanensis]|uniref:Adhesin domain-containing protein n=1 Tax=Aquimarina hainanensis TaxID=1578017 RepID=A0ABW5NDQ7_9FLAO|nr:hypothetical protein [Aquimarina sp. TRL1]QKX03388.1 hypothetical protein HN014_00080 [Aquimarina sp. TRL1]